MNPTPAGGEGERGVSIALRLQRIETQIAQIAEMLAKLDHKIECYGSDISELQRGAAVREVKIAALERVDAELHSDVERLKSQSTWWSGINSALAAIAGLVGWLKP